MTYFVELMRILEESDEVASELIAQFLLYNAEMPARNNTLPRKREINNKLSRTVLL